MEVNQIRLGKNPSFERSVKPEDEHKSTGGLATDAWCVLPPRKRATARSTQTGLQATQRRIRVSGAGHLIDGKRSLDCSEIVFVKPENERRDCP